LRLIRISDLSGVDDTRKEQDIVFPLGRIKMANKYCTECHANIKLGKKPKKGQIVYCGRCGAYMVVANSSPIELEWMIDDDVDYVDDWMKFRYDVDFDLRCSWS
jgi:hypothetical protein